MPTYLLIYGLHGFGHRPWTEMRKPKETTDLWLAQQLRPYGVKPRNLRIGDKVLKGYLYDDLIDVFRRYIPKSEFDAFVAEQTDQSTDDTQLPPLATNAEPARGDQENT